MINQYKSLQMANKQDFCYGQVTHVVVSTINLE